MNLHTAWVSYGEKNEYQGYVAYPKRAKATLPAIIIIQEIWGVDEHIEAVTERFAMAGYVAFAPDLYARDGQREDKLTRERVGLIKAFMESLPPSAWHDEKARENALASLPEDIQEQVRGTFARLFGGLPMQDYVAQLTHTSEFLREEYAMTKGQGVASLGFCMGGALSALLACHDDKLKGAAIFYGRTPADDLLPKIQCPVIGFYGENDPAITDGVEAFAKKMKDLGKNFDAQIYKGAGHAFFNDTRSSYHIESARDAFVQSLSFMQDVLAY